MEMSVQTVQYLPRNAVSGVTVTEAYAAVQTEVHLCYEVLGSGIDHSPIVCTMNPEEGGTRGWLG